LHASAGAARRQRPGVVSRERVSINDGWRCHKYSSTEQADDPTRPTTTSMNHAKPDMPLPRVTDFIS
jgi:hypothetical protein